MTELDRIVISVMYLFAFFGYCRLCERLDALLDEREREE